MFRLLVLLSVLCLSLADLPIDCRFNEVVGTWTITETERTGDASIDCSTMGAVAHTKSFTLEYPNIVTDELGFKGTWTLIYNQGFEININERSYWANFDYQISAGTYDCTRLHIGWSRDDTVRHWSCFAGEKAMLRDRSYVRQYPNRDHPDLDKMFVNDHDFIKRLNEAQDSWTAVAYPQHEKYTNREMRQRSGGFYHPSAPPAPATEEQKAAASLLPTNFDWRDVGGVNYLSPVRDQGSCGSCYSFASAALLESRVRIETHNARQDIFSPQDLVSCSVLNQGCNGGFAYLNAGRYAKDVGFVAEECMTYTGTDSECTTDQSCGRTFVSEYEFVGGYYGANNEENMMDALVLEGPLAVDFEATSAFRNYNGGIFHEPHLSKIDFDPVYIANHVVLLVGYGVEPTTGEKFWIVKNSWGAAWGEEGFFRIRRGTNEVSIESAAFSPRVIS